MVYIILKLYLDVDLMYFIEFFLLWNFLFIHNRPPLYILLGDLIFLFGRKFNSLLLQIKNTKKYNRKNIWALFNLFPIFIKPFNKIDLYFVFSGELKKIHLYIENVQRKIEGVKEIKFIVFSQSNCELLKRRTVVQWKKNSIFTLVELNSHEYLALNSLNIFLFHFISFRPNRLTHDVSSVFAEPKKYKKL